MNALMVYLVDVITPATILMVVITVHASKDIRLMTMDMDAQVFLLSYY